jgi:hypothetical protein
MPEDGRGIPVQLGFMERSAMLRTPAHPVPVCTSLSAICKAVPPLDLFVMNVKLHSRADTCRGAAK